TRVGHPGLLRPHQTRRCRRRAQREQLRRDPWLPLQPLARGRDAGGARRPVGAAAVVAGGEGEGGGRGGGGGGRVGGGPRQLEGRRVAGVGGLDEDEGRVQLAGGREGRDLQRLALGRRNRRVAHDGGVALSVGALRGEADDVVLGAGGDSRAGRARV